eukprot:TRINITY_DN288_c0_g1_i9.p1 TRINITY_DN288_c0_g1~~TRINITY_DN288_c0_g1_i9.p1  ORF type:complete len:576 (+),score=79.34 TRINITY_DN288_c0_g1_i9:112-1839(+)
MSIKLTHHTLLVLFSFILLLQSTQGQTGPGQSTPQETPDYLKDIEGWHFIDTLVGQNRRKLAQIPDLFIAFNMSKKGGSNDYKLLTSVAGSDTVGLQVGGQKGINTFRKSIQNEKLPSISDLTHHGIFYDYYFDIESKEKCSAVFCGKYSGAISRDALSDNKDFKHYYLAVGLESGQKKATLKRRDLDLVVVLDTSGSMRDKFGETDDMSLSDKVMSKLDVAKEAINNMIQQLNENDRFGLVTFDDSATNEIKLNSVTQDQRENVKSALRNRVHAEGATSLEAGLKMAASLMQQDSRENRIIVISDANINEGEVSAEGLAKIIKEFAEERDEPIYTSLVGVGLDFNSMLTEQIIKTKGANYFTVYSPNELRRKLDEEFQFMVTPILFDLKLELDRSSVTGTNTWYMAGVYGVSEFNAGMSEYKILEVSTLYPSPRNEDRIKGGIILVEVAPTTTQPGPLILQLQYTDQFGSLKKFRDSYVFDDLETEFFGSKAVQKSILLTRYVNLLHAWLREVTGSKVAIEVAPGTKLEVPRSSARKFIQFADIIEEWNEELNDENLVREIKLLEKLGLYGLSN